MLEALAKLLKVLNSETQPGQISLALALSMIVGFTPVFSLHNIVVIFFVLTLRVNLSAFLLGFITFSGMAYLLDPLFNDFGRAVLTYKGLEEFWTGLYNSTFWRMTRFNNTIVMGSFLSSLIAFMPVVLVGNFIIRRYRTYILAGVRKIRLVQIIKASKFYNIYKSLYGLGST